NQLSSRVPMSLFQAAAAAGFRPAIELRTNPVLRHISSIPGQTGLTAEFPQCYYQAVRPVLIFDLDGTLVDSKKDLTASVNHIRSQFDLPNLTEEEIARFIGNGALMLIRRALAMNATEANVQAGLQMFLSYYRSHMLDSTTLYPGVRETLDRLTDCKLAVLT